MDRCVKCVTTKNRVTSVSLDIKAAAEVEKIWILYNLNGDETMDFMEVMDYLIDNSKPRLTVNNQQIQDIYNRIDKDRSGLITKPELEQFIRTLMEQQTSPISFVATEKVNATEIGLKAALRHNIMRNSESASPSGRL